MLSTTPNGGPTTYVAINGMLPTNAQQTNPPGTMFAIPSGLTGPNFLSAQNFAPFIFPPLPFSQGPPNLTCAVPYSTQQLQPSLLPFMTPTANGMLTTNPPGPSLTLPPQFNTQLPPHLLQPPGHNLASFTSSIPCSASMSPLNTPNSLMHDNSNGNNNLVGSATNGNHNHNGMAISSVTSTMFTNHMVSSPLILPTLSFNMCNPNDVLSFSLAPQCTTTAATSHPSITWSAPPLAAATSAAVMTTTTATVARSVVNSVTPSVRLGPFTTSSSTSTTPTIVSSVSTVPSAIVTPSSSSASEQACTASSLSTSCKSDKTIAIATSGATQPILSASANSARLTSADNLHALESVDFHRDVILDAIDKLRERKARPDFERISCLLKRHQNINPDHTQVCLGRLAAAGAVVCVDYKGNLSYRNPSKWRKTATNSTGMNPSGVSQRLVDAVRRLMICTAQGQQNSTSCADPSITPLLNAQPGPNGGYSLFQIERALQAAKTNVENVPGVKPFPELTGATLRVCLDREATHGKLAKNPDGRYVLDEFGERKKLAAINNNGLSHLSNKKPIPPCNGSALYLSPNGPHNKHGKFSSSVQPIAPAGEYVSTLNRPLAVKQTANGIGSLAPAGTRPLGLSPIQPLLSRTVGSGRRGRPPGLKSRRHSAQNDTQVPLEKKIKSEPWSSTTEATSISSSINQNATTLCCSTTTPISFGCPLISVAPNGFCTSTAMSLPTTFIPGLGTNGFNSTILPSSILPAASFSAGPPMEFPLSQFMTYSTGMQPISAADDTLPLSSVAMTGTTCMSEESRDFCKSVTDRWLDSPSNTLPSDSVHSDADSMMNEKMEVGEEPMLCSRCCEFPTKEEPFLICKDCNLGAHPTCLDYWPELTERARQSPWQCSDCKSCHVCHGKEYNTELLVCDACDKGFHSECHVPKLEEPVDRSLPWVCADCQKEGYSVAIGTLPGAVDAAFSTFSTTTTTTTTTTSSITTATTATTEDRTSAEHETTCQQNSAPSIEVVGSPEKPNTSETAFKPSKHLVVDSNPTVANSTGSEQSTLSVTPDRHRTRTSRSNSTTPASLTPTQNKSTELSTNDSDSSQLDEVPGKSSTSSASVVVLEEKTSTICQAHTSLVQTSQGANSSHVSHKPKSLSGSSPSESHASSSVDRSPEKTSAVSGSCRPPTIAVDYTPRSSPPLEQTNSSASTDRGVHRSSESAPTVDELPNHSGSTTYTARPDDIRAWSVDHVRDWLLEEGFPREAEAFSQQEIDGACLLLMKRMDVLTELGIKLGPAVKIYERIKRLQSRCTSPTILCT